jgi:hypothetical protein
MLAKSVDDRNQEAGKKMSHVILKMCGKGGRAINRFQEWRILVGLQALSDSLELSRFLFVLSPPSRR